MGAVAVTIAALCGVLASDILDLGYGILIRGISVLVAIMAATAASQCFFYTALGLWGKRNAGEIVIHDEALTLDFPSVYTREIVVSTAHLSYVVQDESPVVESVLGLGEREITAKIVFRETQRLRGHLRFRWYTWMALTLGYSVIPPLPAIWKVNSIGFRADERRKDLNNRNQLWWSAK